MEEKIVYFDKQGVENTEEVLLIAKKRAAELGIKTIVVATTLGNTATRATEVFKGMRVVVVTHSAGLKGPNTQELTEENRQKITANGGNNLLQVGLPLFQFICLQRYFKYRLSIAPGVSFFCHCD